MICLLFSAHIFRNESETAVTSVLSNESETAVTNVLEKGVKASAGIEELRLRTSDPKSPN